MASLPTVALIGNPNTGKSTLFNQLTGGNARVGNYPGITVERLSGTARIGERDVEVVDVPGCYSLAARSPDERVAIDAVLGRRGLQRPALLVLVVDATNLERNLYLALQLQELELPFIIALNQMDAAGKRGLKIDAAAIERRLGVAVVPIVASLGQGLDTLRLQMAAAFVSGPRPGPASPWRWEPSPDLSADLDHLVGHLGDERPPGLSPEAARAVALWALMSIDTDDELDDVPASLRLAVLGVHKQARLSGRDPDQEVAAARYGFIDACAPEFLDRPAKPPRSMTERIDRVLIHPVLGFVVFLLIMFVIFQALFAWSDPAIGLIEDTFAALAGGVRQALGVGVIADFIADGLIGGVGSVIVFLPQIILLFTFIGLLEDSGYMARVAFLMDRIMNRIGLHGRAFVPMMSGFACAVPAIMATRTMERTRDRILTMMVVPLMTCSARLPVYTLIIGSLFPVEGPEGLPVQGLLMVGMYLFGTVTTLAAAAVIGRTILKGPRVPLLLELPAYHRPQARSILRLVSQRARVFLTEAGTVILVCTIALWGLLTFPRAPAPTNMEATAADSAPERVEPADEAGERLRQSYGGRLGRFIEPVIEPLGFDWKIGVGLVGAFAAREVFVSTMGVVYGIGAEVDEENATLRSRMKSERHLDGTPVYTPLMGLSLMLFFSLACQCMSTLAAVKRETASWRWPTFMFVYMGVLAWVVSFVVYQTGRAMGLG